MKVTSDDPNYGNVTVTNISGIMTDDMNLKLEN